MTRKFTHLHVHTGYSLLDGAAKVEPLINRLLELGETAIASTDHGNLYAIPEMSKICKANGIKYIPGFEAYQAKDTVDERPKRKKSIADESDTGKLYYHLTTLAMDEEGYKNLIKLSSKSFLEGFYNKPRIDWDMLSAHSNGLIVTSSCLGGLILQALLRDDYKEARNLAGRYKEIFGDRFYIEVQDHGIPEQHKTNWQLVKLATDLGLKLVATNDLHYINASDAHSHDILLCCQTKATLATPGRFKFSSNQHYLKSADEMYSLFSDPMFKGACENTIEITDRCNFIPDLTSDQFHLPKFPYDEALFDSEIDYLKHLTFSMAKERYGNTLSDEVVNRINYELDIIGSMGFANYFLINWDLMQFAEREGIQTGYGRGSAGGCIIAYCLRITHVDPIKYDLYFERFLNPSRISMPDIDSDFDTRYREKMIRYCAEKYGRDRVTQIITMVTLGARSAIRDVTKVLGYDYSIGTDIISKMPPPLMGKETPLDAALSPVQIKKYSRTWPQAKELRELYASDKTVKEICDQAIAVSGLPKTTGVHAGAVIIADAPLTDYLPEQVTYDRDDSDSSNKVKTTQFTMEVVESLGLLKMDFLGLRNLDVVSMTVDLIRKSGKDIDVYSIPDDDENAYRILQKGLGIGLFQVESRQMQELMKMIKPESINDIAALVALYRPGPMGKGMHTEYAERKHGKHPITYIHDDAKEILDITYGVMTYQEQMMEIAVKFAGYSLAESDNLRKITGKKLVDKMAQEKDKFISSCINNGYSQDVANQWWELIEPFADYSFNKSHAVEYALLTYLTAYLKANYPAEYMSALLTSVKNKLEKAGPYISEAKKIGVQVKPVDINKSDVDFIPEEMSINFALSAIRNVGTEIAQLIVDERNANGPYTNFYDFCHRVPISVLKNDVLASLIKAGAFDKFHPRKGLVLSYQSITEGLKTDKKKKAKGLISLPFFDEISAQDDSHPPIPNETYTDREILAIEREFIGCYVTKHPLDAYQDSWNKIASHDIHDVLNNKIESFTIAGTITSMTEKMTKKGELMCVLTLSDFTDSIEVVIFPKVYKSASVHLDEVIKVSGKMNMYKDDSHNVIANKVETLANQVTIEKNITPLTIHLKKFQVSDANLDKLKTTISNYPGNREVCIRVDNEIIKLGNDYKVSNSPMLLSEIRRIFNSREVFN